MFSRVAALVIVAYAGNVASGDDTSPVEKVVSLLTDLRDKVNAEGTKEAETYNKFACFCKDTMEAKSQAISEGETQKDTFTAQLNDDAVLRNDEDKVISEKTAAISEVEGEVSDLRRLRRAARAEFEKNNNDMTGSIQALEAAIHTLKATRTATGLVEVKSVAKTARAALVLADAMGLKQSATPQSRRALTALLEQSELPAVPDQVYEFKGGDIITMLEDLETSFRAKKEEIDSAEAEDKTTFDATLQEKQLLLKDHEKAVEDHKKAKAELTSRIKTTSEDLSTTAATLLDDQSFLKELSTKCNAKAKLWDQRTEMRANELQALTGALDIIKNDLPSESESDTKLIQTKVHRHTVITHPRVLSTFTRMTRVRTQAYRSTGAAMLSRQSRAVALLKGKAQELHSALLLKTAGQAAEDPFAKVKALIQELIEKLLKQAAEESNEQGWCSKMIAVTTQERDGKSELIADINGRLEIGEARRGKLAEEITKLEDELAALDVTLKDAEDDRTATKAENEAGIADAEQGRDAVKKAIELLDRFYKTAAKASSVLQLSSKVIRKEDPEIPDAGFDSAYGGSQGDSTGVIGMLEVVQGDFERAITDTQAAEKQAEKDYYELTKSAEMSKATKEVAKKARDSSKTTADAEDEADRTNLGKHQASLDTALTELDALKNACNDGGMSGQERTMQRDQELAALNRALCIISSVGPNVC